MNIFLPTNFAEILKQKQKMIKQKQLEDDEQKRIADEKQYDIVRTQLNTGLQNCVSSVLSVERVENNVKETVMFDEVCPMRLIERWILEVNNENKQIVVGNKIINTFDGKKEVTFCCAVLSQYVEGKLHVMMVAK